MRAKEFIVEKITQTDINWVKQFANNLWHKLSIDIQFTTHFIERLSDPRNRKDITVAELAKLFVDEYKKYGGDVSKLDNSAEAVFTDLSSNINLPFVINKNGRRETLVVKSAMRKANFATTNTVFAVEDGAANHYRK